MQTTIQQHCEDCLPKDHSGLNFFLKAVLTTIFIIIVVFLTGFYLGRYTVTKHPTEINLPLNSVIVTNDQLSNG